MKTVGQTLQEARLNRKIDLDEVSRITRIRPTLLKYLEADDYRHLPSSTIVKGFIRNYSEFLGLNPDHAQAIFRRDFIENEQGQIVPRGMVNPINRRTLWTPRTTILFGVIVIFIIFGGYLLYQYQKLTGPPTLLVKYPADQVQVTEPNLEISGSTDPEATLSVNGQLIILESGGQFVFRVPLQPGENSVTLIATSKSGKITSLVRHVYLTTSRNNP
jgi:cytoskeletal protein RodZ